MFNTNRQDFFDNWITTNHDVQEITQILEDFRVQAYSLAIPTVNAFFTTGSPCPSLFPGNTNSKGFFEDRIMTIYDV